MGRYDYYKPGDWNAICEVCGQKFKASKLKRRWDGLLVCKRDWEPRHPQDFVRGVKDKQSVPFTRKETPDSVVHLCGPCERSSVSGIAVAGCSVAGNTLLNSEILVCLGI